MSARVRLLQLRRSLRRGAGALALVAGISFPAYGGGPLDIVNHLPVVYPNGATSLQLNLDQGPFGTRTNAQTRVLVQNAIGLWNGVGTATMRLAVGPSLSTDYNATNYASILNSYSDGINPVIFDTDGSLTDAIFGAGAKSSVLGFAGSAYYTSGASAGKYAEGKAVLNGALNVSDGVWTIVLAHEFGHFFGLDHSQIDNVQGVAPSNYVLMYPIAYRTLVSLHEDDVAAVTSLYPSASAVSVYGQLQGTFTTAGGTPIVGANIWARENVSGKVYSVVSDFLMQGNGYFRLYLPAGTYTLRAESIDAGFTGGSGVGPYANSSSDRSFQPPHPITPVAFGGASPQQIVIAPGCLATATFRLDGTGGVSGNCGSTANPPAPTTTALASSANPAVAGTTVALTATVTGAAPTGVVGFLDSGTAIAGCSAVTLTAARTAVCSTSVLVAGVHSIVAVYGGDVANATSSSAALSQVVNAIPAGNVLTNGVPVTGLAAGAQTGLAYTMVVPSGATNLRFTIAGGTGDANLYVRFGSAPTTTAFDCRPKRAGNNEYCSFPAPQAGTYYVMVRGGQTAFSGVTLTGGYTAGSGNLPPTANFTFSTAGLTANFTDASTDSDGTVVARSWDFGDGTTSTSINPSRSYATAGTRNVTLTVTDNAGAVASVTKPVAVGAVAPPSNVLTNGVPVTGLAAAAQSGLSFTMVVPAGTLNLMFTILGGTGDADLYVRFGSAPTTTVFDCRPKRAGNAEYCSVAPPKAGTYYVMVLGGTAAFSGVTLTGSYQ